MAIHDDLITFGVFLRQRRRQLGLTQTQLAERIGWTQERVSVLENGKYGMPSLPQLSRLADGLDLPLDALLDRLGVRSVRPAAAERRGLTGAQPPLSHRLVSMLDQMHVVEERLRNAERRMHEAESLTASIREQRRMMRVLLDSCSNSGGGRPA
jgi:transcriptional regulator with XRE-family HTH domain